MPDFAAIIAEDVDKFTQVMIAECADTIINRTPVDSASLVGSEHVTNGSIPGGFRSINARGEDPGGARYKQMSVIDREIKKIGGHKFYFQTNASYAMDVHRAEFVKTGTLRFMKLYGPDIIKAEKIAAKAVK